MPHYLAELIEKPNMEAPADEAPEIHRHFTRYSRGNFPGPVMKISTTAKNITLNGSFEYEKALGEIFVQHLPEGEHPVTGAVVAPKDLNNDLKMLGIPLELSAPSKSVKTKNYKCSIKQAIKLTNEQILDLLSNIGKESYILLSIKGPAGSGLTLTTKKSPPRPNQKNPDESSPDKLLQFCKVKLPNKPAIMDEVIKQLIPDFKGDLPKNFKKLTLVNQYRFTDLDLPKEKIPSRLFRIKTVRIGKIIRTIDVDGKEIEKQYNVRA